MRRAWVAHPGRVLTSDAAASIRIDSLLTPITSTCSDFRSSTFTVVPSSLSALPCRCRRRSLKVSRRWAINSVELDKDARRFYAIARGSALECAAIVDVLKALSLIQPEAYDRLQALLDRIVAMLTKLIRD